MSAIITLNDVYRAYRMGQERILAVNGVSLEIEEGEICCMKGPSGSGKSTLLHLMAGLDKPSKGTITIGKNRIDKLNENQLALFRQRYVGFIFQSYYLIPTLTALENVAMLNLLKIPRRIKRQKSLRSRVEGQNEAQTFGDGGAAVCSIARAFANNPVVFTRAHGKP